MQPNDPNDGLSPEEPGMVEQVESLEEQLDTAAAAEVVEEAMPVEPEVVEPVAPEDDVVEPEVAFTPNNPESKFTPNPDRPQTEPLVGEKKLLADAIVMFREAISNVGEVLNKHAEAVARATDIERQLAKAYEARGEVMPEGAGNRWVQVLAGALQSTVVTDDMQQALYREGADWAPFVSHEGKILNIGQPKQRLGAGQYSPDELLAYVTKKAGTGTTFDIPMWHSGIWLRLKTPTLQDITAFTRELAEIKIDVGSQSRGLAFSNVNHLLQSAAVNFALTFVTDASIPYRSPSDIKAKLDDRDSGLLLLGLACNMYPNGYHYAAPCVADPKECQHVVHENLNLRELAVVDRSSLTRWQVSLMNRRLAKSTEEDLKRYREEHTLGRDRLVWFNEIGLMLAAPTAEQQERAGRAWIDGLIEMSHGAFNEPPHGPNRNRFINELANSSSARQYAHWVKGVYEKDPEAPDGVRLLSEDEEFISKVLTSVFTEDQYMDLFKEKVTEFIQDSLVAMPAIHSYNCPQCNSPAAEKFHQRFQHLIPVDPLSLFFILANRRLNQIL